MSTIAAGTTSTTALVSTGDTTGKLTFQTNGTTTAMTIDTSQNVGIGTSSPGSLDPDARNLVVGGGSGNTGISIYSGNASGGRLMFADGTSGDGPYVGQIHYDHSSNYMRFITNGNERMRITSDGKLLVGTSTASSSSNVTQVLYKTGDNYLQIASGTTGGGLIGQTGANMLFYTYTGAVGSESFTERMRLSSDGNLAIGNTNYSNVRLYVVGQNTSSANWTVYAENSSNVLLFGVRNDGAITTGSTTLSPYNNTTGLSANVLVGSDGFLYRSTSSLRYKSNVQDATHGLADVLKLRSVTYNAKNSGDALIGGLIAEEVDAAGLKEFVVYDKDGQPDALHYGNMVALLTKAIQELKAEVDALKAQLAKV